MKKSVAIILLVLGVFVATSSAVDVTLFGPSQYVRTSGAPDVFSDAFIAYPGSGTLIVINGSQVGEKRIVDTISSAKIFVNGVQIFGPNDFNKNVYLLKAPINLVENNSITIELASRPNSYITVEVIADIDSPTVTFSADPATIFISESSTLSWQTNNADSCVIGPGIGTVDVSGATVVSPMQTTAYTITATGLGGTTSAAATVTILNRPPVADAGPDQSVFKGDTVSLNGGDSNDVDGDSLNYQWSFLSVPAGSTAALSNPSMVNPSFVPDIVGTYEVQLIVNDGTVDSSPDIVVITADPRMVTVTDVVGQIQADAEAALIGANLTVGTISTANSDTIPVDHVISQAPAAGASVEEGSAVDLVVSLGPKNQTPAANISASPATIQQGESVLLSWSSFNAQSAHIDKDIGIVDPNGSISVFPDHTTTYTLAVTGPAGSASAHVTVMVLGNPEPQPEGHFGEQYEDLIPPDATVDSYDPKRFSLITGLVQDSSGAPIADVAITLHSHPEYGTATTDAEGRFSIPVEGGSTITVAYQKDGLISAHRKVQVPWNDIAIAETIQMIAEDPASTTLTFDGNPDTVVTHQSSVVTDEFGSRSATMVFTGDNRAYLVDENGNDVQELTTITTRATEYATPESMPAELPPTSAFTYCVELIVDGAERVRFEKPVVTWINNFLGFQVGEIVPVGYYDRDRGVWVPSDNGVVVKLLDTNADGIVDALDADGDDQPDDLDGGGEGGEGEGSSFSDEVIGLDDPVRFPPGSTFWRVAVTHFTPWDCNWPYGPPEDAIAPNPDGEPIVIQQKDEGKDCNNPNGSSIEERSGILHEDIPIPGTSMTLHYKSGLAKGRQTLISIPASGDTVPGSLERIFVKVDIAGRTFYQYLDPGPNQKWDFIWDGLDYRRQPVGGSTTAHVAIGFVYDLVYYSSLSDFAQAFGLAGTTFYGDRTGRARMTSWKYSDFVIDRILETGRGVIAEGWTVSPHHYISRMDMSTLHKGDGTINKNRALIIDTVVNEWIVESGEGPYTDRLDSPRGVAVDAAGNSYIADSYNHRVLRMDSNGVIITVAGNGMEGYGGDNGPAIEARLNSPSDLAVDASGNLYIADGNNHVIRKVDRNGIITTVAGLYGGDGDSDGDGGPATLAYMNGPWSVAVDASGNLYIGEYNESRVRKVSTSGIIETVAGNGTYGYGGDGGQAVQAQLRTPSGVAIDASGNLYIAENGNHVIRKVDTGGTITTVAGNGTRGYSGDLGPATQAQLSYPKDITVDAFGNLYLIDENHVIRKVDTSGIIFTVAGDGSIGFSGDNGPATQAQLNYPCSLALDPRGNIYVADSSNNRIRQVAPVSAFAGDIAAGDIVFTEKTGLGHIMYSSGRHKKSIDLDTGITLHDFGYDLDKNLVSITDRFGNQTAIARDANGVPNAITSPDGITTNLTIDANNHLNRITYPDGSYYSFEYTSDGLLTAGIEPEGNRFEHEFNLFGELTGVTDEEGGHWIYNRTVNANGYMLTEVWTGEGNRTAYGDRNISTGAYTSTIYDPTGAQTVFSQSVDGLTVNKSLPCGMELEFKYDIDSEYGFKYVKEIMQRSPSGLEMVTTKNKTYEDTDSDDVPDLITETVAVNGKTTTLAHSTLQAQKTVISPEGRTATSLYDPNTLLTESLSIPGFYDTLYGYDPRGRLTSISTNTRQSAFAYNSEGLLETVTDPENYTTTYSYDPVGRVTGISRPDSGFVGFTYDKNGNMTVLTNPVDVDHGFGFSSVNLNSSYQTPLSGNYSYVYDKDRRLIQTNFPSGKTIINDYADPLNPDDKSRLWQIKTPEGNIDFTYLCGSKVESITKGAESIIYGYDGKLVTSVTLAGTLNQSLDYTYNNDFDVSSFTYADAPVAYSYDNDGLLTRAGAFTVTRNADNGLPETVTGGALNLARIFNGYGEVNSQAITVNSQNVASWSLTRDNNGRITDKTETVSGAASNYVYTYDAVGRLLTVTKDSTLVEEYQYDLNGTRTYEMNSLRGITGRNFTYSDEDHLLFAGSVTYNYDLDGFLTTKTDGSDVTNYSYSARGELLSVNLPDSRTIEYIHDPLGRRIAKKVYGVTVEKYLWQGLTRLLAVYDGSDNLLMRFDYADGRMPVAVNAEGVTYYLSYDQVGSLRLVADSVGNVIKSIEYDSFGNILSDSNPTFAMPFGFAGGLHDQDTGLVRFGHRDYDPDIGRWTAKDPILFAGGDTDLYGYVLNDPINFVDPIGLLRLGDAINWASSVIIPIAREGGLITAKIATRLSIVGSVLGELVDPPALNADEDWYLHQLEVEYEIEQYQEILDEINRELDPVLRRFHVYDDELNGDKACP